MAGSRTKTTARVAGEKRDSPEKPLKNKSSKKKKTVIEETTNEQYRVIDEILGYRVNFVSSLQKAIGTCGLTATQLPFYFFPLLTREPPAAGTLPVRLGEDRGYFAGGDKPSTIRIAIIQAYLRTHPSANPVKQGWTNWEVWHHNVQYYGNVEFNAGPGDIDDIRERLLNSYEFGGFNKATQEKIARTCTQKRYQLAVSTSKFFKEKMPEGLPEGAVFFDFDYLLQQNQRLKVENEEAVLLKKSALKKKLADAETGDAADDEESSSSDEEESE